MKRQNDMKLGDVLDSIFSKGRIGDKLNQQKVIDYWKEEMGYSINSRTESLSYRKGVLRIRISSAPLRQQLMMEREKIRQKLTDAIPSLDIVEIIIN